MRERMLRPNLELEDYRVVGFFFADQEESPEISDQLRLGTHRGVENAGVQPSALVENSQKVDNVGF